MGLKLTRGSFAHPASSLRYHTGSWRMERPVHRHRPAPCHTACPAGEDAQAWLALIAEERYREAWEKVVAVNPLPAITGRVCHHPCEVACNRGHFDEPVAIHHMERWLGDKAIAADWDYPATPLAHGSQGVAVIGSGPAGCSAAWQLSRRGYKVDLFEALPVAGGLLRSALPHYRLPRDVLDAELERLLASGITFRPGQRLGRDFSLDELKAEYAAVFLAPGTQRSREWNIDGATPHDLHVGLDLLKRWVDVGTIPEWSSAAVIGGGNTAIDLARILRHCGVETVHVVTHQSLPRAGVEQIDTMSAIPREIEQAMEEGVIFHEHRGVQRLVLRGEQVIGLELVHRKELHEADGSKRYVSFEGTESLLHVDQVIPAIGQSVDPAGLSTLLEQRSHLDASEHGRLDGHPGLYAGGDACGGHGSVSAAIGDGRRAALAIERDLQQQTDSAEPAADPVTPAQLNMNYFEPQARQHAPVLPVAERSGEVEIIGTLTPQQAAQEAMRCLSCGNCLACDNCWTLCPDIAVLKTRRPAEDGSHYLFDYDFCKGCGLCARECPTAYIMMEPEQ